MSKYAWKILPAVVAVTFLAACSGGSPVSPEPTDTPDAGSAPLIDLDELIAAAQGEGELLLYTPYFDTTIDALAEVFEEQYGISITWERLSSGDMPQRIQADIRAIDRINADVVTMSDHALAYYLRDEGLTKALTADMFPEYPEEFLVDDAAATVGIGLTLIGYNPEMLGDWSPSTWDDLLDPRLSSGNLMVVDPRSTAAWAQFWTTLLNDPSLGEDYVSGIAAQEYQPVATGLIGVEQLVAEQSAVLIASAPSLFDPRIEQGQPLAYFIPENPAPVTYNVLTLTENADNPNAALLFAYWLLGAEGSQLLNSIEGSASPFSGLDGVRDLPMGYVPSPSSEAVDEALPEILDLLGFN